MKRFLVTGAAGFIGSKVAGLVLKSGNLVTGVDNLNDAHDVRLKEWRLRRLVGWYRENRVWAREIETGV